MPEITPSRWLPLFYYTAKIQKTSEITKHFVNYFVKFSKLTIDVFNARLELFRALRDENEIL